MSEHRRPTIPFSDAPRGACRWCGESILYADGPRAGKLDRRRRWHPDCVAEYNLSDPREARGWLRRRERGVCRACGLDTYRLRREIRALKRGRAVELRRRGFHPRQSLWELDHVVPLIDGGTHARDNLQTLCVPCHRQKTAQEARDRAERRRVEAEEPAEKPAEKPNAELAGEPAERPAGKLADKPNAEPAEKPAGKLADKPNAEPAEKPAGKLADEPAGETAIAPDSAAAVASSPERAVEARPRSRRRTRGKRPAAADLDAALRSADAANERVERLLAELDPARP